MSEGWLSMSVTVHSHKAPAALYSTAMSEIDQYDYEVPHEQIAQRPLLQRSDARLMVVHRDTCSLEHTHVRNLPEILRPGDCLVLNDTRVIPARLVGYRTATRGRWSGLFLSVDDAGNWKVISKTRGKLAPGETITLQDRDARGRLSPVTADENARRTVGRAA